MFLNVLLRCLLAVDLVQSAIICNIVEDFGAIGDGIHNDTLSIQTAINKCGSTMKNSTNPAIIQFPSSYNFMSYPLLLADNIHLWIQYNSSLSAIPNINNWPICVYPFNSTINNGGIYHYCNFVGGYDIENIQIYGEGIIDGNGDIWWEAHKNHSLALNNRPNLIVINSSNNIEIYDVKLLNSPSNHIKAYDNNGMIIHDINITCPGYDIAPETDGIAIGSENVYIYNCYVSNGDDSIVMKTGANNVTIEDCLVENGLGIVCGTGSDDTWINDIIFENITLKNMKYGIKVKSKNNGKNQNGFINNVTFRDIKMINITYKNIDINQLQQNMDYQDPDDYSKMKDILFENIRFLNISGNYGYYPGYMECTEQVPCFGFLFENITLIPISDNTTDWFCGGNTYGNAVNVTPKIPQNCLE